ncbi:MULTISPECIES: TM2 domain-containing protein [unclassified Streptococcus]|uniref:TM2 domain-containing protein n=1 Tax=unclassified Streptococcus TaxID=2608887 RepID=UPI001072D251|nr:MULTISPECIES: TM2 domain-containing protein [unclassified Streptococcus]MBF0775770.1 NINE protein [Streptococcus sp. 19428wD3_AN2]TFU84061.1 NINE protein [Streptococcus sp. AN2]
MNYTQSFLMANMNAFPSETLPILKEELDRLDEEAITMLLMTDIKSPVTALLFSIFLGELGVDRFYIGNKELGIAKLALTIIGYITLFIVVGFFLLFGVYVWKLIDCFFIMRACKQANFERLMWQINQAKMFQQARAKSATAAEDTAVDEVVSEVVTTVVTPAGSEVVDTAVDEVVSEAVTTAVTPLGSEVVDTAVDEVVSEAVTTAVTPLGSEVVDTAVDEVVSEAVTTVAAPSGSELVDTAVDEVVSEENTTVVTPSGSEVADMLVEDVSSEDRPPVVEAPEVEELARSDKEEAGE